MAKFRTCIACKLAATDCEARRAFAAATRDLRITSVKWRCASRVPVFAPGDPCFARTVPFQQGHPDDEEPPKLEFPAHVIAQVSVTRFIVFIDKGALPIDDGYGEEFAFEPKGHGYCKIPLSRLRPREGEKRAVCPKCQEIDGKHADYCGGNPPPAHEEAPF